MCGKMARVQQTVCQDFPHTHHDLVRNECSQLAAVPESATGHWKRSRLENYVKVYAENKSLPEDHFQPVQKKRATSATTAPAGTDQNREILDELAGRLGLFHDSARALAKCLQTRDVARKTDQCMIEAANCMFHRLLGETSEDLERVVLQLRESLHIETTRYKRRCSRFETPSEKPRSCPETLVGNPVLVPRQRLRIAPRWRVQNLVLVR